MESTSGSVEADSACFRRRSIDATGLFWACMLGVVAWLFSLTEETEFWSGVLLWCLPACLVYQVWIWRHNARMVREATAWLQQHFGNSPPLVRARMVDFLVTLADIASGFPEDWQPETPLDKLNWELNCVLTHDDLSPQEAAEKLAIQESWLWGVLIAAGIAPQGISDGPWNTLGDVILAIGRWRLPSDG
jgi:hypothetical protein